MITRLEKFPIINGVSLTTTTSASIQADGLWGLAMSAFVTSASSPSGALTFEFSNDNSNFAQDVLIFTSTTINAAGPFLKMSLRDVIGYRYMRAVYTHTSGTGSLTVLLNGIRV